MGRSYQKPFFAGCSYGSYCWLSGLVAVSKGESEEGLMLSELVDRARMNANHHGWVVTGENLPTYLMLIVSEVSEAMDAWRDTQPIGEELADIVIRVAHMAGDLSIDLECEIEKKMAKNEARPFKHGHVRM